MGDSMMYPGHILAKKEVVVVTFNYRLGALGNYLNICYKHRLIFGGGTIYL